REKVWRHAKGDILVGEVTEISLEAERRRRIYLTSGSYLMVEIANGEAMISGQGKVGCIVLGNKLTQRLAGEAIKKAGGRMNEEIMRSIFADIGSRTASVSKEYTVLRTEVKLPDPAAALLDAFREDCKNSKWKLCGQSSQRGQQPCSQHP
ncbi:MAG: DUF2121 domain-containing protein, partial [Methanotrichaceae archaeon]|nr:DUF2121 domain-containing protein [Methanotrichaceae archaeon]